MKSLPFSRHLLLLPLVVVLAACSDQPVVITEKEAGQVVEVPKGGRLQIQLESNPTTGFSWAVTRIDSEILKPTQDSYFTQNSGAGDVVGAGGIETLVYKAVKAGSSDLRLEYRRPFEQGGVPEKVLSYEVKVVE